MADDGRIRYTVTRMCGGKSIMLTPRTPIEVDLDTASECFSDILNKSNPEFIEIQWGDTPVTIYKNGSIFFYHLNDHVVCEGHSNDILRRLGLI